ncbi:MAG: AAA family ATPase [Candidatus Moeniiplasma glomeromycotorum]|nr:AAA family ATPase [Candidatus Moeniiplasma glomeromycotorum]MCE8168264.1 AAA family ATPase [Candidatus Moeniiplasma glomeromycotorum]MCE8169827.1 AAA family ATPase [Candidatus Moeniiplasma glomeromycotorum]
MANPETPLAKHNCLGKNFATFNDYWNTLKKNLDNVHYIVKVLEKDDGTTTLESDLESLKKGFGIQARFIGENFYKKFRNREYVGEEQDFVLEFTAELALIIAEIRRKEHVWTQLYRNLDKIWKVDRTETEKTTGTDKTTKTTTGDASKQQLLSKELTERTNQHGTVSASDQKGGTTIITHKGTNYMPLGKILGALNQLQINFSEFYPRFEHLWNHYTAPTLEWVIDPKTGKRKWVTEDEAEAILEPEKAKAKKKLGPDAFAVLDEYQKTKNLAKYLEALAIYHDQNEKEHNVLPETSNRKPRIANRVKIGEGLKKAYEKFNPLPTVATFRNRVAGTTEITKITETDDKGVKKEREIKIVYDKIIGYENIIKMVEMYLDRWELMEDVKPHKISPPKQLMIALMGPPGLGKSYIAGQLAKALGRGYEAISLNGKKDANVVYGTDMSNPGSNPGEITKAISRSQDQTCVILWDEIEKAGNDAKMAIGIPTDKTQNWLFKDVFYDFPSPCNNVIFFAALNYPEDLPDFVGDRFRKVNVKPLGYKQRIEVARRILQKEIADLEGVWMKYLNQTAQQIFNRFGREELIKKTLTWTFSIRGTEKNITGALIPNLLSYVRKNRNLPHDLVNHDWDFASREDTEEIDRGHKERRREACPYSQDKSLPHRTAKDKVKEGYVAQKCVCFVNNLNLVPGWKDNMGAD